MAQQRRMNQKPTVQDLYQNFQNFTPAAQQQQHPNVRMPMPAQTPPVVAAGVQPTIPVFNTPTVVIPPSTTVNAPAPAPAAATITQANARPLM